MKIKEVIVVEGKYDKIAIENAVDAVVLQTDGFSVFSDKEKLSLIRKIAEKQGIILLTDSDGAGFVIRNYLKSSVKGVIKQAYIPDISGKERRKSAPSKENKLGVEGMKKDIIIKALLNSGATVIGEETSKINKEFITKTDMYLMGLSGGENSAQKRKALLKELELPEHISANALLDVINILYDKEEFVELVKGII